jgi:hypothetical protein
VEIKDNYERYLERITGPLSPTGARGTDEAGSGGDD